MNKLRECPFCGGGDVRLKQRTGVMRYYWVECDDCYCGTGEEDSKEIAIAAWNRRPDEQIPEDIQEAIDYFENLCNRLGNCDEDNRVCKTALWALKNRPPGGEE